MKVSKELKELPESPIHKRASRTIISSRTSPNVNKMVTMDSNSAYSFLGNLIEREKEEYLTNTSKLVRLCIYAF